MNISRIVRSLRSRIESALNATVLPVADAAMHVATRSELTQSVVFIIGPPRSGSTLLMQLIDRHFAVGYFTNAHCKWYGSPLMVERLSSRMPEIRPLEYTSEYGHVHGSESPSECGEFWYRFLPRKPAHVVAASWNPSKAKQLRKRVMQLSTELGKTMVFKNLVNSLRIQALSSTFPDALYLVIDRDLVMIADSLLEARVRNNARIEDWWSVEPPGFEAMRHLPAEAQVVEQVRKIREVIDHDLDVSGVSRNRILRIQYEDLCANPAKIIKDLGRFFDANDAGISRTEADMPGPFPLRTDSKIPSALRAKLERYIGAHPMGTS